MKNSKQLKLGIFILFLALSSTIICAESLDELIADNTITSENGTIKVDITKYHGENPITITQTRPGAYKLNYEDAQEDVILVLDTEPEENPFEEFMVSAGISEKKTLKQKKHEKFKSSIEKVENILSKKSLFGISSNKEKIRKKELEIIEGIALKVDSKKIEELKASDAVKAVYPDEIITLDITESAEIINATKVWAMQNSSGNNITGEGITIAIIDSGIDYTHPDLGACDTPEFLEGSCEKVIGGYDFVNDDNDPFDDNGHGTHCAGIAAADGTVKGIAPKAKLLAYKPMNSEGSGSISDIIAAIENATNAGADIISMSLGGSGDENSALSLAANNAFQQGVVVVSSAGNSGPSSYTINSPGNANLSLTVGATDSNDNIQSFSSRGPTANYNIKPDVVAPGYEIQSTVPSGSCTHCSATGYKQMSGTSMACPMVSGTAALLKQMHPEWDNEEVRAAIINTADDLNESIFAQGTGRIDALKAINTDAAITPTSKSFGVDESVNPDFNKTQIFTIKNLGDSTINYNLSTDIGQAGIDVTFNQTEFSISAGESMSFTFNIYVNNSELANGEYEGHIYANGTKALRIPLYFMKSSMSEIHFKEAGAHAKGVVHIHDRNNTKYTYETTSPLRAPIDPGVYDIVVKFGADFSFNPGDKWVIRENVSINDSTITIDAEEAVHLVNFSFKDIDNNPITDTSGTVSSRDFRYVPDKNLLNHWSLKFASSAIVEFDTLPIYVSNMSDDYALIWRHPFDYEDVHYDEYGIVTDITSNYTFDLGPDTMKKMRVYYPDITEDYNLGYYGGCDSLGWTIDGMRKRSYADMFYTPLNDPNYWCKKNGLQAMDHFTDETYTKSPNFYAENTTHIRTELSDETVWLKDDLIYKVSESGHFWYAGFGNTNTKIYANSYKGNESNYFYSQTYDDVYDTNRSYKLYDSGTLDSSGSLDKINFSITQGRWSLVVENNFTLNTIENSARVNATFDTSLADKNPPAFKYLHMYTDNLYSDFVYTEKTNEFEFELDPVSGTLASVDMWYYDTSWHALSLTSSGNVYNTSLPSGITTTKVRFRILAVDDSGNSLDYEFDLLTDLGADFKISSLSLSEDIPAYEDNLILNATIENIGIRPGEDVVVSFYDNSNLIGNDTIPSIPASSSAKASVSYTITDTGLRNITVIADPSDIITEINESNNQHTSLRYYMGAEEQLLTKFSDSSYSKYLNMTDKGNQQLTIKLPAYSKVNYALLDVDGEKIVHEEKKINQPVGDGSRNFEETSWEAQSINISENRIARVEMNMTPRDNLSVITEPPFLRIRKDNVVNDVGVDITEAIVPRESFDDSYIENKDGNRGYRWKSFNFSDYDPLTPETEYYLVVGTLDPYDGVAYVYRTTTADQYPGGKWYNPNSGGSIDSRDFQFSMYTQNISYIKNLSFYPADQYHWNYTDHLYTLNTIPDFSSRINVSAYTDADNDSYVEIPLNFTTAKAGYLNISNLKVYYDLADIIIENLTLSPNPLDRGANTTITAIIKNNASADIDTILIFNTTKSTINQSITLPAGQTRSFNHTFNTSSYNSTIISAVIDPENYIIESDEANNNLSTDLIINNEAPVLQTIANITANETDLITITPSASDPDGDNITYYFTSPLNSSGQWQTDYLSAGNYTANITASDGELNDTKEISIEVFNINRPPILQPIANITINETQLAAVTPNATDPDGDNITYHFSLPLNSSGEWQTNYSSAGTYNVNITASDSINQTTRTVVITVLNLNRLPNITSYSPSSDQIINETENITFSVNVTDPDPEDVLSYSWYLDSLLLSENTSTLTLVSDYDSEGIHNISAAINDSYDTITISWNLTILDVNRPPVLQSIANITLNESELLTMLPNASDPDGDNITYYFTSPLNSSGQWQTDYLSAGNYTANITASDGELNDTKEISIEVFNINRPPILQPIANITINETQLAAVTPNATDPDGDSITYHFSLPLNSSGEWQTDLGDDGNYTAKITASDGELNGSQTISITVNDVPIACFNETDCGTDSYIGTEYCSGKDVYQAYRDYTCHNPGTISSMCSYTDSSILKQTCTDACENGSCVSVECFSDSDCPDYGWAGNNYCSGGDLYGIYRKSVCSNNGTSSSSCDYEDESRLKQDCTDVCKDGSCTTEKITCSSDSDCGDDYYVGYNYCKEDDVYRLKREWNCVSPGTTSSRCEFSDNEKLIDSCTDACESGVCTDIECYANSDCGDEGWEGLRYCKNDDSYRKYAAYSCTSPGTASSSCVKEVEEKKKEDCSYGCSNGYCMESTSSDEYTCSLDTHCGTDSYVGEAYCEGNQIKQTYRTWTCHNPATNDAYCRYTDNIQTKDTCSDGCLNGACLFSGCLSASDCGTDSYVEAPYCNNGDVYQIYRTWTCDAGNCDHSDSPKLKESCSDGCKSGSCIDASLTDLPDLKAEYIFNQYPKSPSAGDSINMVFDIENIGETEAENIGYKLYTGSSDADKTGIVSSLEPGKRLFVVKSISYASSGIYYPRLVIDHRRNIQELDEGNNEVSTTITIS